MPLYDACVPQMSKMLRNLDGWIDEAIAYAKERDFDVDRLASARLSPDMFTFTQQVQSACDTAKFAAHRLGAKEAPSQPDEEKTIAELKARIASTIAMVESVERADFEGSAERELSLPFLGERKITGASYFDGFAQPNFYFHVSMAYAILRHNGVKLGKRKYIGGLDLVPE